MNRRPSHIRASARRPRRGFTLLLALGLIAMVTVAVLVTLRAVSTESNLQGHERRAREALFAAEAGMAEARVVVQAALGESTEYDNVFVHMGNENGGGQGLDGFVQEAGLPSTAALPWYEVIPWTDYEMTRGAAGAGIDTGVATANRELIGPDGEPIQDYPEPINVRYRVFIVDDADEPADNRRDDANNHVWLVAVGEVSTEGGGQPYRTIIRSLVGNKAGTGGGGGYGTKRGGGNRGSYGGSMPPL